MSATEQQALLATCAWEFHDRRDTAVIRLLLDTGMRLAELAGLSLDDLDLDQGVAVVLGKGRRPRACPFGTQTSQALDRYLRFRERHRLAALPDTWLTRFGPMTGSAIAQMVRRRAPAAAGALVLGGPASRSRSPVRRGGRRHEPAVGSAPGPVIRRIL